MKLVIYIFPLILFFMSFTNVKSQPTPKIKIVHNFKDSNNELILFNKLESFNYKKEYFSNNVINLEYLSERNDFLCYIKNHTLKDWEGYFNCIEDIKLTTKNSIILFEDVSWLKSSYYEIILFKVNSKENKNLNLNIDNSMRIKIILNASKLYKKYIYFNIKYIEGNYIVNLNKINKDSLIIFNENLDNIYVNDTTHLKTSQIFNDLINNQIELKIKESNIYIKNIILFFITSILFFIIIYYVILHYSNKIK